MGNMDVESMVYDYLKEHDYEGLFNPSEGCGCVLGDLSPGSCICDGCCAGYLHPGDDEYDFYIMEDKLEPTP